MAQLFERLEPEASTLAERTDAIFQFLVGVSLFFTLPIFILILVLRFESTRQPSVARGGAARCDPCASDCARMRRPACSHARFPFEASPIHID